MERAIEYRLLAAYAEARSNLDAPVNRNKWRCLVQTYLQLAEQADADTGNDRDMHDPVWSLLDRSAPGSKLKDSAR
jgi:hypothetical protein